MAKETVISDGTWYRIVDPDGSGKVYEVYVDGELVGMVKRSLGGLPMYDRSHALVMQFSADDAKRK